MKTNAAKLAWTYFLHVLVNETSDDNSAAYKVCNYSIFI